MRKPFVVLGALALGSGAALVILLGQLRSDFFRAFLPPWVYAAYGTTAIGALLIAVGFVSKPAESSLLGAKRAGGIMARLALLNAAAASLLLAPVIVPSFRLPILITEWPGIYMVLAYFSFLAVGVLGMAVWSLFLVHAPELLGRDGLGSLGFGVQVTLTEIGILALTVSMFLGGYVGSVLAYSGAGPVAVGAQMEFSVIPSAVSIYLVAAGTLAGVLNVLLSGRSVSY